MAQRYRIKPLYKFQIIPAYRSIEGGKPSLFLTLPLKYEETPENLPKDEDKRAEAVRAHFENPKNVKDRTFERSLMPIIEYTLDTCYKSRLIPLIEEVIIKRPKPGTALVGLYFIDENYLEPIE